MDYRATLSQDCRALGCLAAGALLRWGAGRPECTEVHKGTYFGRRPQRPCLPSFKDGIAAMTVHAVIAVTRSLYGQ